MDSSASNKDLYQWLAGKGLKLSEIEFNSIINEVKKGIVEAKGYLKIEKAERPVITFFNDTGIIGFSPKTNTINLRLDYLNLLTHSDTGIEYKDQLICYMPDKFYMVFKYLEWLRLFGIESAVHYYQFHESPNLKVRFPEKFPEGFSPKSFLVSDLEIETRKTVDQVLIAGQDKPVWQEFDFYLEKNFAAYYNKSIEELAKMERPNLPITFEMENLLDQA